MDISILQGNLDLSEAEPLAGAMQCDGEDGRKLERSSNSALRLNCRQMSDMAPVFSPIMLR